MIAVDKARYHIFRDSENRKRAYVIDIRGNKVFHGTVYSCRKFIDFMKGTEKDGTMDREGQTKS